MKLRNVFQMQVMVVGLGAALLLGGSVRAQELENTNWDDGPGVVPFAQQAPAQAVATPTNPDSVTPAATTTQSIVTQAGVLPQLGPANDWMMGGLNRLYSFGGSVCDDGNETPQPEYRRQHRSEPQQRRSPISVLSPN
jgi:hypothetical protein